MSSLIVVKTGESGQSLLEFAVSLLVIVPVLIAAAGLLGGEWRRTRCAYRLFETARAQLNRTRPMLQNSFVQIQETSEDLRAQLHCGNISEQIRFPKLEYAQF